MRLDYHIVEAVVAMVSFYVQQLISFLIIDDGSDEEEEKNDVRIEKYFIVCGFS